MSPESPNRVVLLVEDNRGDIFLVRSALAEHQVDCSLHVVNDGEQAIQYLMDAADDASPVRRPDLILLDLNLPKRSGTEVLERLRTMNGLDQTPVIVMSSSTAPKDRTEITRLNALKYFTKPTDLQAFMSIGQLVKEVLP